MPSFQTQEAHCETVVTPTSDFKSGVSVFNPQETAGDSSESVKTMNVTTEIEHQKEKNPLFMKQETTVKDVEEEEVGDEEAEMEPAPEAEKVVAEIIKEAVESVVKEESEAIEEVEESEEEDVEKSDEEKENECTEGINTVKSRIEKGEMATEDKDVDSEPETETPSEEVIIDSVLLEEEIDSETVVNVETEAANGEEILTEKFDDGAVECNLSEIEAEQTEAKTTEEIVELCTEHQSISPEVESIVVSEGSAEDLTAEKTEVADDEGLVETETTMAIIEPQIADEELKNEESIETEEVLEEEVSELTISSTDEAEKMMELVNAEELISLEDIELEKLIPAADAIIDAEVVVPSPIDTEIKAVAETEVAEAEEKEDESAQVSIVAESTAKEIASAMGIKADINATDAEIEPVIVAVESEPFTDDQTAENFTPETEIAVDNAVVTQSAVDKESTVVETVKAAADGASLELEIAVKSIANDVKAGDLKEEEVEQAEESKPNEFVAASAEDNTSTPVAIEEKQENLKPVETYEVDTKPICAVSMLIGRFEQISTRNSASNVTSRTSSRHSSRTSSRVSSPPSSQLSDNVIETSAKSIEAIEKPVEEIKLVELIKEEPEAEVLEELQEILIDEKTEAAVAHVEETSREEEVTEEEALTVAKDDAEVAIEAQLVDGYKEEVSEVTPTVEEFEVDVNEVVADFVDAVIETETNNEPQTTAEVTVVTADSIETEKTVVNEAAEEEIPAEVDESAVETLNVTSQDIEEETSASNEQENAAPALKVNSPTEELVSETESAPKVSIDNQIEEFETSTGGMSSLSSDVLPDDTAVTNKATAKTKAVAIDALEAEKTPERNCNQLFPHEHLTYEILGVTRAHNVIMYHIYTVNSANGERSMSIPKRYSEFKLLNEQLRALNVSAAKELPILPKPSVGSFLRGRRSKKTIELREKAFGDFLHYITQHEELHKSAVFQQFIDK